MTQQQKVLKCLRDAKGKPVSARYMKQVMLISEVNGRISELRKKGYKIETSKITDEYGFKYHRLLPENDIEPDTPEQLQKRQFEFFEELPDSK